MSSTTAMSPDLEEPQQQDSLLEETVKDDKKDILDTTSKTTDTESLCSCTGTSTITKKAINVSAVTIAIEEAIKSVDEESDRRRNNNSSSHAVSRSKSFDARLFRRLDIKPIMKRLKKQGFYASSGHFLGGGGAGGGGYQPQPMPPPHFRPAGYEPPRFRITRLFSGGSSSNVSNEGHYYPADAIYTSHHYEVPTYIDHRPAPVAAAPPPPVPPKQRHHKNKHKSTSNLVRRSASKLSLGGGGDGGGCGVYNTLPDPYSDQAVLLSVRRRSNPDSIYEPVSFGSSNDDSNYFSSASSRASKDCSPRPSAEPQPPPPDKGIKAKKMGFLKFFQKSGKKHQAPPPPPPPLHPTPEDYRPLHASHSRHEYQPDKSAPRLLSTAKSKTALLPPNFTAEGVPISLPSQPQPAAAAASTFSAKDHLIHMLKKRRKSKFAIPQGAGGAGFRHYNHHHQREDLSSMSSLNSNSRQQQYPPNRRFPGGSRAGAASAGSGQGGNDNAVTTAATVEVRRPLDLSSSTEDDEGTSGGLESDAGANGSNYDSGAFSRTSSPTADEGAGGFGPGAGSQRRYMSHDELMTPRLPRRDAAADTILNQMRLSLSTSMSRLALSEPLNSPALVLAAISKASGIDDPQGVVCQSALDTSLVWAALNAASVSSAVKSTKKKKRRTATEDVSVTVTGSGNTMLTIAATAAAARTRGGPLLGTSVLCGGTSPGVKKTRNKISTVYLQTATDLAPKLPPSQSQLERSDSMVTVMGSTVRTAVSSNNASCKCQEVVTVNGQHLHCPDSLMGRHPLAVASGLATTAAAYTNAPIDPCSSLGSQTQPNSLVLI